VNACLNRERGRGEWRRKKEIREGRKEREWTKEKVFGSRRLCQPKQKDAATVP